MTLARTQQAAASLRDLLQPPAGAVPVVVEHRRVPATPAAAVTDVIDVTDANPWYQGALGELHALLAAQKITPSGPGGAMVGRAECSHARPRSKVSTSELYSARAAVPGRRAGPRRRPARTIPLAGAGRRIGGVAATALCPARLFRLAGMVRPRPVRHWRF
jgi:hypothetical protein